ncbi:MAG: hypothetical protein KJ574_00555 [Nanoarchaeota archaeon]|nr:hypothetical protein [Nanoarchaeota archaeon]
MDKLLNVESKQVTYFFLGIFVVILLIFAGCVLKPDKITNTAVETHPLPLQEEAANETAAIEETPAAPEEEAAPEEDLGQRTMEERIDERSAEQTPIGNRVWGEGVPEETVKTLEGSTGTIYITSDKKMSESVLLVSKGTTLTWVNEDTYPHNLLIEQGTVLIEKGPRMEAEDMFAYKFDTVGEFLVRDMFAGTARMTVIVS